MLGVLLLSKISGTYNLTSASNDRIWEILLPEDCWKEYCNALVRITTWVTIPHMLCVLILIMNGAPYILIGERQILCNLFYWKTAERANNLTYFTTHVVYVNFINEWWRLKFKRQIIFCQKTAERKFSIETCSIE